MLDRVNSAAGSFVLTSGGMPLAEARPRPAVVIPITRAPSGTFHLQSSFNIDSPAVITMKARMAAGVGVALYEFFQGLHDYGRGHSPLPRAYIHYADSRCEAFTGHPLSRDGVTALEFLNAGPGLAPEDLVIIRHSGPDGTLGLHGQGTSVTLTYLTMEGMPVEVRSNWRGLAWRAVTRLEPTEAGTTRRLVAEGEWGDEHSNNTRFLIRNPSATVLDRLGGIANDFLYANPRFFGATVVDRDLVFPMPPLLMEIGGGRVVMLKDIVEWDAARDRANIYVDGLKVRGPVLDHFLFPWSFEGFSDADHRLRVVRSPDSSYATGRTETLIAIALRHCIDREILGRLFDAALSDEPGDLPVELKRTNLGGLSPPLSAFHPETARLLREIWHERFDGAVITDQDWIAERAKAGNHPRVVLVRGSLYDWLKEVGIKDAREIMGIKGKNGEDEAARAEIAALKRQVDAAKAEMGALQRRTRRYAINGGIGAAVIASVALYLGLNPSDPGPLHLPPTRVTNPSAVQTTSFGRETDPLGWTLGHWGSLGVHEIQEITYGEIDDGRQWTLKSMDRNRRSPFGYYRLYTAARLRIDGTTGRAFWRGPSGYEAVVLPKQTPGHVSTVSQQPVEGEVLAVVREGEEIVGLEVQDGGPVSLRRDHHTGDWVLVGKASRVTLQMAPRSGNFFNADPPTPDETPPLVSVEELMPAWQGLIHAVNADSSLTPRDRAAIVLHAWQRSFDYRDDTPLDAQAVGLSPAEVAAKIVNTSMGICNSAASGPVILFRAVGLPSRYVTGYLYDPRGFNSHGWVEFWDGVSWVPAEPQFGRLNISGPSGDTMISDPQWLSRQPDLIGATHRLLRAHHWAVNKYKDTPAASVVVPPL